MKIKHITSIFNIMAGSLITGFALTMKEMTWFMIIGPIVILLGIMYYYFGEDL